MTDYDGLVAALRARADELNVTRLAIDERAGLPSGYTARLLTSARYMGQVSMGPLLGALGLALVVVEDPTAAARLERMPKRDGRWVRKRSGWIAKADASALALVRERARKAGLARFSRMSPEEVSAHQSRAAKARWRKAAA